MLDYRDYEIISSRIWRSHELGRGIEKGCHPRMCQIASDLATHFEKNDDKFNWKAFMDDTGCFGSKLNELRRSNPKIRPKRWEPRR